MRIVPVMQRLNSGIKNVNNKQTQFVRKSDLQLQKHAHKYTGVASIDLAYVSMFDNKIAQDLKMMGLI